jgi:hypothetical protein
MSQFQGHNAGKYSRRSNLDPQIPPCPPALCRACGAFQPDGSLVMGNRPVEIGTNFALVFSGRAAPFAHAVDWPSAAK